VGVEQVK